MCGLFESGRFTQVYCTKRTDVDGDSYQNLDLYTYLYSESYWAHFTNREA